MNIKKAENWQAESIASNLGEFEIHVWRIDLNNLERLEAYARRLEKCLSAEECNRAARFHFLRDRTRFVIRRGILRHLLASYLGLIASAIKLLRSPNGKPSISAQDKFKQIHFNSSQSGDWGLIALTRGLELGVDLEQHRPLAEVMALASTCFSRHEISELNKIPEKLKTQHFYKIWTCKEAFVKAIGLGLSFPLNNVSISLAEGQSAEHFKAEEDFQTLEQWRLVLPAVNPDYSAAVVYKNPKADLKYFTWKY